QIQGSITGLSGQQKLLSRSDRRGRHLWLCLRFRLDLGSALHEQFHHWEVAFLGRDMKRSPIVAADRIDIRSLLNQEGGYFIFSERDGQVQHRVVVEGTGLPRGMQHLLGVNQLRVLFQQCLEMLPFPFLNKVVGSSDQCRLIPPFLGSYLSAKDNGQQKAIEPFHDQNLHVTSNKERSILRPVQQKKACA